MSSNSIRPLISVVIPALNEEKTIGKTLSSLIRQDYADQFEVIVADNGSNDKTAEIARQFGAKVIFAKQKGVARARQAGFEVAKGDIVASTDADTILPGNWLSSIISEFNNRPDAVAICGMFHFYDGGFILKIATSIFSYYVFKIFDWCAGFNLAVKKEAFTKVGGFNLNLALAEDIELCRRLKKVGKVYLLPFLKVKTSARRFNKLGFFGGLWDYSSNYFKIFYLHNNKNKAGFKPVFESPAPGLFKKSIQYAAVVIVSIAMLFGTAYQIKPVKAAINNSEKKVHNINYNNLIKLGSRLNIHYK